MAATFGSAEDDEFNAADSIDLAVKYSRFVKLSFAFLFSTAIAEATSRKIKIVQINKPILFLLNQITPCSFNCKRGLLRFNKSQSE